MKHLMRTGGKDSTGSLYKGKWSQYLDTVTQPPTTEEIQAHLAAGDSHFIGWYCGHDKVICIDVDYKPGDDPEDIQYKQHLRRLIEPIQNPYIEKTPGGVHIFFKVRSGRQRISPPTKMQKYGPVSFEYFYKGRDRYIIVYGYPQCKEWYETPGPVNVWSDILGHINSLIGTPAPSRDPEDFTDDASEWDEQWAKLALDLLTTTNIHASDVVLPAPSDSRNHNLFHLVKMLIEQEVVTSMSDPYVDRLVELASAWNQGADDDWGSGEVRGIIKSCLKRNANPPARDDYHSQSIGKGCRLASIDLSYNIRTELLSVVLPTGESLDKVNIDKLSLRKVMETYHTSLRHSKPNFSKQASDQWAVGATLHAREHYSHDPLADMLDAWIPSTHDYEQAVAAWESEYGIPPSHCVFHRILGLPLDDPRPAQFFERFYLALAARIANPNKAIEFPYALILTSKGKYGKSQFLDSLLPEEMREYQAAMRLDRIDLETDILLTGKYLAVINEMPGRSNYNKKALKDLITRTMISYRAKYAVDAKNYIPTAFFVMSTNDESPGFDDEALNRRLVIMSPSDYRKDGRPNAAEFMRRYSKLFLGMAWKRVKEGAVNEQDLLFTEDAEAYNLVVASEMTDATTVVGDVLQAAMDTREDALRSSAVTGTLPKTKTKFIGWSQSSVFQFLRKQVGPRENLKLKDMPPILQSLGFDRVYLNSPQSVIDYGQGPRPSSWYWCKELAADEDKDWQSASLD